MPHSLDTRKERYLQRRYGLTIALVEAQLALQGGRCLDYSPTPPNRCRSEGGIPKQLCVVIVPDPENPGGEYFEGLICNSCRMRRKLLWEDTVVPRSNNTVPMEPDEAAIVADPATEPAVEPESLRAADVWRRNIELYRQAKNRGDALEARAYKHRADEAEQRARELHAQGL